MLSVNPTQTEQYQSIMTTDYLRYQKGLNSYALFKISDPLVAQDLVQDTFMRTWKYLVEGGKVHLMKAFLYSILNKLIVDQYRRHKAVSLDALFEKGFETSEEDQGKVLDVLDGSKALLLIKELPPNYRKVMHMRYVRHLSIEEMSLITGKSRNAVAVQAHRGLAKLKLLYHHGSKDPTKDSTEL
jgi:RNA polymerase sigma-70 factor, ECF subfamily